MLSRPALLAFSLSFSSPPPTHHLTPSFLLQLSSYFPATSTIIELFNPAGYLCFTTVITVCKFDHGLAPPPPLNISQNFLPNPLTTYSHMLKLTIFMISLLRRCSLRHYGNQYKSLLLVNGFRLKNMQWSILYKIQWAQCKYAIRIFRSGLFAFLPQNMLHVYRINIIKESSVV